MFLKTLEIVLPTEESLEVINRVIEKALIIAKVNKPIIELITIYDVYISVVNPIYIVATILKNTIQKNIFKNLLMFSKLSVKYFKLNFLFI